MDKRQSSKKRDRGVEGGVGYWGSMTKSGSRYGPHRESQGKENRGKASNMLPPTHKIVNRQNRAPLGKSVLSPTENKGGNIIRERV
jgi:hypothetical protein